MENKFVEDEYIVLDVIKQSLTDNIGKSCKLAENILNDILKAGICFDLQRNKCPKCNCDMIMTDKGYAFGIFAKSKTQKFVCRNCGVEYSINETWDTEETKDERKRFIGE